MPADRGNTALLEPATPAEIEHWLAAKASRPDLLMPMRIMCDPDAPGRLTCMVGSLDRYAIRLASELSGHLFGFSTVFVQIDVGAGFSCRGRPDLKTHCSCQPALDHA